MTNMTLKRNSQCMHPEFVPRRNGNRSFHTDYTKYRLSIFDLWSTTVSAIVSLLSILL